MEPIFTKHFIRRVRKRVGLNKRGAEAWGEQFVIEGAPSDKFKGAFKDYLLSIEGDPDNRADKVLVRAPWMVLMRGNVCLTIFQVPGRFRRVAIKTRKRRRMCKRYL